MKINEKDNKKFWDTIDLNNCEVSGNEDWFIIEGGVIRFEDDVVIPDNITFKNEYGVIIFEGDCIVGDNVIFENGEWLSFNGEIVFGENVILNCGGSLYFDNYLELPDIRFKMGDKIQEIILNLRDGDYDDTINLSRNDIELIMNRRDMLEEM